MTIFKNINEYLENKERIQYNKIIDYTKIADNLTNDKVKDICKDADENSFCSVCVFPDYVASASSFIKNDTKITALIDFPKGGSDVKKKISDIDKSINNGAKEVDVVVNYKLIKNEEEHESLSDEIRTLTEFCHREGAEIKIVIEIGFLNFQEIEAICGLCVDNNADFIMTSTGKLSNDDSFEKKVEKVKFMRKILPNEMKIKFAGGVRSTDQIKELSDLVDRIGTSVVI